MGIFDFLKDKYNYNKRKVGRDDIDGLTISTAYTSDEGFETAILDKNGVHPVQRYDSREEAIIGHSFWCEQSKNAISVTKLPGLGGLIPSEEIILERWY